MLQKIHEEDAVISRLRSSHISLTRFCLRRNHLFLAQHLPLIVHHIITICSAYISQRNTFSVPTSLQFALQNSEIVIKNIIYFLELTNLFRILWIHLISAYFRSIHGTWHKNKIKKKKTSFAI